jgi:hypothetical protein
LPSWCKYLFAAEVFAVANAKLQKKPPNSSAFFSKEMTIVPPSPKVIAQEFARVAGPSQEVGAVKQIPEYAVKKHGKTALLLVGHVEAGGAQNVGTFRKIIQESEGISSQGTAGFWTDGGDGTGLVYRTENSGYPIEDSQAAALTKRCKAMAQLYKERMAQASPDQQFWTSLAAHLDAMADLIRIRLAA